MNLRQFTAIAAHALPPPAANTPVSVWTVAGRFDGIAITWDVTDQLLTLKPADAEPFIIDLGAIVAYQVQPAALG